MTLKYAWYASGSTTVIGTGTTFTPTAAQLGRSITVKVTGTKSGYATASEELEGGHRKVVAVGTFSQPRRQPSPGPRRRSASSSPRRPGPGRPARALKYAWYASGSTKVIGTGTTFTPTAALVGHSLTFKVTGTKSGYTTLVKSSTATKGVAKGSLTGRVPGISISNSAGGQPTVGATLTATPGTWTYGAKLSFQWYSNSGPISGATARTYTIPANLLNHTVSVVVTGTKSGYNTLAQRSASTKSVIQTRAYYQSHSGARTTYETVFTGLESDAWAGDWGKAGSAHVAYYSYPSDNMTTRDGDDGSAGYHDVQTLPNAPSYWVQELAQADPGWDNDFDDAYGIIEVYEKPAGAPDGYYTLAGVVGGTSYISISIYGDGSVETSD